MFIVKELCAGKDLFDVIHGKNHDLVQNTHRLDYLLQIAIGLDYLHSIDLIHGNMSSSNVMMRPLEGGGHILRVCNFGSARKEEIGSYDAVEYLAPEVIGSDVGSDDKLSDIYSFGILMFEVWTGVLPYDTLRAKYDRGEEFLTFIRNNNVRPTNILKIDKRTPEDFHDRK